MKKTISVLLIVITLLNLISTKSFAFDTSQPMSLAPQENGKVTLQNDDGNSFSAGITGTTYSGSAIFVVIANVITCVPQAVNLIMNTFVSTTSNNSSSVKFTIYDTVMGQYDLFDIDYLNVPSKITDDSTWVEIMKYNVLKYYAIMRSLALGISLFMLIYIGIRMAISTVSSDKATYKKMLINWLASVMIISEAWQIESFEDDIYMRSNKQLNNKGL